MMKSTLFLVGLYALTESVSAHAYFNKPYHKDWQIRVPVRVRAARGSCVVIPCSFNYPNPQTNLGLRGKWKRNSEKVVVSASRTSILLHKDYAGRTVFIGNVNKNKDCTWMLKRVRDSDEGKYFFRIDHRDLLRYRYSWTRNPTEVQVFDAQPPIFHLDKGFVEGQLWGFCSVVHSCPVHTPELTWSHGKKGQSFSNKINDWQWVTYTQIIFTPRNDTLLQEIHCAAKFYGGQTIFSNARSVHDFI